MEAFHPARVPQSLGGLAGLAQQDLGTSGDLKTPRISGRNLHCCCHANPPFPVQVPAAESLRGERRFSLYNLQRVIRKNHQAVAFWLSEAGFLASRQICRLTSCVSGQGRDRHLLGCGGHQR